MEYVILKKYVVNWIIQVYYFAFRDYRPGDLPYPEQDERKKFCNYHYKGVLVILIPILCIPILFGREYIVRFFETLTIFG